jgi:Protein of unknown function (DUF3168)
MPTAAAALGSLQKAIATLVTGNAANSVALMALIGSRLYDYVSEDSIFPYVSLYARAKPWFNQGRRGREATVEFDVWSKYSGFEEANGIVDALVLAFDHVVLTVAGFAQAEVVFAEEGPQERMPDGLTRHIAVYFTVHLEQT